MAVSTPGSCGRWRRHFLLFQVCRIKISWAPMAPRRFLSSLHSLLSPGGADHSALSTHPAARWSGSVVGSGEQWSPVGAAEGPQGDPSSEPGAARPGALQILHGGAECHWEQARRRRWAVEALGGPEGQGRRSEPVFSAPHPCPPPPFLVSGLDLTAWGHISASSSVVRTSPKCTTLGPGPCALCHRVVEDRPQ